MQDGWLKSQLELYFPFYIEMFVISSCSGYLFDKELCPIAYQGRALEPEHFLNENFWAEGAIIAFVPDREL
jgi:hypothetical protein